MTGVSRGNPVAEMYGTETISTHVLKESIETDSLGMEESVVAEFDSGVRGESGSAADVEMGEHVAGEVASEVAELDADIPDEVEVVQNVGHNLSPKEMNGSNAFAASKVGSTESEIDAIETEFESSEGTDAGSDTIPDGVETVIAAQHSENAESGPTPEATPEPFAGEDSQPEATSEPLSEEEETMQNTESDTRSDAKSEATEFDKQAKTVAQVSAIVMAIAVVVLWLLLR